MSGLLGKHIEEFTKDCPKILNWINDDMFIEDTDHFLQGVIGCIQLWPDIYSFIRNINVDDDYLDKVTIYENNCIKFYEHAKLLFMDKGKNETFYIHSMRCYITQIARETYTLYGCGYGLWSMQACEQRNY